MQKMKENRAGHYIPKKFAYEIEKYLRNREDVSLDYVHGACAALAFLTTYKESSLRGATVEKFFDNDISCLNDDKKLQEEAISKAQEVIEQLEAMGVGIVGVNIVRIDN